MRCHRISVLSVLAAMSLGNLARTLSESHRWDDMRTKHSWEVIPDNWESLGDPPVGTTIDLHIALKPHRENALIDALHNISDPGHSSYGAHLLKEQVAELVAPHPHTLELVNSWLDHHSVPPSSASVTHGGSTLTLAGVSVTQANDLLGASYQLYRHAKTNETIVCTVGYALPAVLHGHVQTVVPATLFASPRTQRQTPRKRFGGAAMGLVKSTSGGLVTVLSSRHDNRDDIRVVMPPLLRWLYNTYTYVPAATYQNVLGIVGFRFDYPSPADLAAFMRKYRTDGADAAFTVVEVDGGGYDPSRPNSEANMDIQYALAMAYPTPHVFYSTGLGPSGTQDWFISWLRYILNQPSIPQTISISYGYPEKVCSREYTGYVCNLFAQLGARGVSVLIGSGDDGVGEGDCLAADGSVQFTPSFPASCPWVTAVGGTTSYAPEVAATLSGGGFSNHFLRPNYQQEAVSIFLENFGKQYQGPYQGLYNTSGRGIPDTAAQAVRFLSFTDGIELEWSGTSASAPVVAGIVSLLNDYLLSKGRPPLGFLNPLLYGVGLAGLNDIIVGSNPGCNTVGFPAIPGWDPVTGHGTPDFARLKDMLDSI